MAKERSSELTAAVLMGRKDWRPLPAIAALHGEADFLKREVLERFIRELSSGGVEPWVRRYAANEKEGKGPSLAEVLDDLRTPSFLSPVRLVIVQGADAFLAAHREALEPCLAADFAGGHLVLLLDSLDQRTRFGKSLAEKGWAVSCQKPFDRPPPWKPDAEPWDNDLSRWVAARARQKELVMDLELAQAFCQRVGTDLARLDEELEKLRTYLAKEGKRVDLQAVEAVAGELREDSVFDLVDAFLGGDRRHSLEIAGRLLRMGYHPPRGSPILAPTAIWTMFVGALVGRLRALRRAHALSQAGQGPEAWMSLRLTHRPFLPRFQRDLKANPGPRIARALAVLRELDRTVKTGGSVELCLERLLLKY
jgi:DNA polymerase III delta subunit